MGRNRSLTVVSEDNLITKIIKSLKNFLMKKEQPKPESMNRRAMVIKEEKIERKLKKNITLGDLNQIEENISKDINYINKLDEEELDLLDDYYSSKINEMEEILNQKYSDKYFIEIKVLNAKDYGVCQSRPRAIVKLYKKGLIWGWPTPQAEIPLSQAIGKLPSLEAGQDSGIPWHYAKQQNERAVLALRHTPTGKSALTNEVYYPKKEDGTRIKGFHNTFKRMTWDEPCPTRTTFSGSMSSHNNVHPGRLLPDGTYSDARVLTLLETFIVSSIPEDIDFPKDSTDTFIRTVIGEAIPPKLLFEVVDKIGRE